MKKMKKTKTSGLLFAYLIDAKKGSGKSLNWAGIKKWKKSDGLLWIHLNSNAADVKQWIETEAKLDLFAKKVMMEADTRSRIRKYEKGTFILFRGIDLSPGADPEDMVPLYVWIDHSRIITLRRKKLFGVQEIVEKLEENKGPQNIGDFILELNSIILRKMQPILSDMEDTLEDIEERVLSNYAKNLRYRISEMRIRCIMLRRYIAPQREILLELIKSGQYRWLSNVHKTHLRENLEHVERYIEGLDIAKDHASIIQDEITNNLGTKLNRNTYMLSLVATICLPLGLLTGLFGVNLAGIPHAAHPLSFGIFSALLVALLMILTLFFKWKKWF